MFTIRLASLLFLVAAIEPAPVQDPVVVGLELDLQSLKLAHMLPDSRTRNTERVGQLTS